MNTPRNLRSLLRLSFCLIAIIILAGASATATTIEVNTLSDTASDDGQCTLREAITAANTNTTSGFQAGECVAGDDQDTIGVNPTVVGDTITFAANVRGGVDTHPDFVFTGGIGLTAALPVIETNISIVGPGSTVLAVKNTIQGNLRIFTIASGARAIISGLKIMKGRIVGEDRIDHGEDVYGGGIFNAGTLTITECLITDNYCVGGNALPRETGDDAYAGIVGSANGGGIYNSGILTLKASTVEHNIAQAGHGTAGESSGGGVANHGRMTIINSVVRNNDVDPNLIEAPIFARGEGIFNDGIIDLVGTLVSGNGNRGQSVIGRRRHGGGLASSRGVMTLIECTVVGNWAIANSWFGSPHDPKANGATGYGGGIYVASGLVEVIRSSIRGNIARAGGDAEVRPGDLDAFSAGGGIFVESGTLTVTSSTISENFASAGGCFVDHCDRDKPQGGGVYLRSGTAKFLNSTLAFNYTTYRHQSTPLSGNGGGIFVYQGIAQLHNTIISENFLDRGVSGPDVYGAVESHGHNFIGQSQDSSGWISSDLLNGDPQLAPLGDNGGPTLTYMPTATSPLINAGDNTGAPLTDQRGVTRLQPWNTTVDIGAVEGAYHPPVAHCQNRGLQADQNGQATTIPQLVDAGSTDPDGEPLTFTWDHAGPFSLGDTQVILTVTDRAGLSSTCTATITVGDFIPPMLILPASMSVDAQTLAGATVNYEASARDVVDGVVPITCSPASGSTFPLGQTSVRCTAIDSHGNRNDGGFEVSVEDYVPPVIENPPNDITVATAGPSGAMVTWPMPTSSDLIAGALPVTCTPPPGSTFPVGNTVVTCSATDTRGNRTTRSFNVTVAPPPQPTLHITADGTFRYDGMSHPVLVAVTGTNNEDLSTQGTLTVTYTDASGYMSTVPPKDVGTYAVNVSFVSASNYSNVSDSLRTITITKAPLRIKALTAVKTYGDPTPDFKVDYLGFVFGERENVLDGSLGFDLTAIPDSPVESYTVIPKGLTARNYDISFLPGILHVEKARLIVTAADARRQYGEANPTFTGLVIGLKNGDHITADYSSAATSSSTAGNYAIVPSLQDPDRRLGNYEVTINNGSLIIDKTPLTVTAKPTTKVYGAPLPAFEVSYSGFVLGQNESSLSGTLTFSTPANSTTSAGTYPVTPRGLSSSNYALSFVDGPLTITRAVLTVTANDATKVLGEGLTNFSASYAGFVNNDGPGSLTGALTISTNATPVSSVGTYTLTPGGLASPNYDVAFHDGSLKITYNVCLLYDLTKSATGGTFPLKTQLCDINGGNRSSAGVTLHADGTHMLSNNAPQALMTDGNANPDFNFRFDSTLAPGGGYIFNLSTKGFPSGTFIMTFSIAGDPVAHTLQFSVK